MGAGRSFRHDAQPKSMSGNRSKKTTHVTQESARKRRQDDDAAAEPYPMPAPYPAASLASPAPVEAAPLDDDRLRRIEETLDRVELRLQQLEQRYDALVPRSDWVDVCARLDIVEQLTTETLGQVRSRLEVFGKEVKQIAVIPERELSEMTEVIRLLRRQMLPDSAGNQR